MENISYLIVDFQQFTDSMESHILSGKELLAKEINTEGEYSQLKTEKQNWEKQVPEIFKESFSDGENFFLTNFLEVQTDPTFHLTSMGTKRPLHVLVKDAQINLTAKINNLMDALREIEQCEYIVEGQKFDLKARAKFTTKQKLSLILQKLFSLNDGRYYSIEMLLMGNGIKSRNYNEPREFAKILEDNGYVKTIGGMGGDILASITSHGTMQIEEQAEPRKENYNDIPGSQDILNEKIDEIIEALNTHGLGQEILFNELQELRDHFSKMNKKNWGQLLKGKLIDLAIGKVVENDTLSFIYEKLTGHEFNLLG